MTISTQPAPLRRGLRLAGFVVLLGAAGFWFSQGAHTGWTQNQVPVRQTDEITGIEFVTYEQRFVPGIEFLGAGLGLATGLVVLSFFFNRKSSSPTS